MSVVKMTNIEDLRKNLAKYGQEHLLRYWSSLTDCEKEELMLDINDINFEAVLSDFKRATANLKDEEVMDKEIKPVPSSLFGGVDRSSESDVKSHIEEGLRLVSQSKVAVLVLAGGQGTRLGVSYPKGMYDMGLPSGKTLFQIQAERIRKLTELASKRHGFTGTIPWFVMTSESTMEPTLDFFKKNRFFGLEEENVIMFEQFMLPAFTFDGKIILENKHKIAMSPDGNGGLYKALRDKRVLDELERRGIEYVHAFSIDNILVKVGDPAFIGYCHEQAAECGVKVIEKTVPEEPIGVVCVVNEKWHVVEYSEIPAKLAEKRDLDGSLTFKAGNICNHVFAVKFLRKFADNYLNDLELHVAKKKIPTIDSSGKPYKPKETNGIKMEKFIFDVFPFADKLVVWETRREEEFSALKNTDEVGKDCPKTARQSVFDLHRKWIEKSGGKFIVKDVICEVSPLLSYEGEGLEDTVTNQTYSSPLHLKAVCE
ncbi:UDP-N-acetylhexosamine pyrophosphorylase [Planococcus citri]|uniref:UDP-N-acetylhexosamine pyrophosphorylase n=1 Tax=Planococcus citri TaxID=170843 RepID=UPI0031F889E1